MEQNPFLNDSREKKYSVAGHSSDPWIESSFGNYSWFGKNNENKNFLGITITKFKFAAIKITLLLIAVVFLWRSFDLQIANGEKYKEWAETNRIRILPIVSERGVIYDRNQKPLVSNIPNFYLAVTPGDLPSDGEKRAELIQKISSIINIPPENIEEQLSLFSSYNYKSIPVKTNISYDQAVKLEILRNVYPALQVEAGIGRKYDMPESLSHAIGYLRKVSPEDLKTHQNYLPADDIGKNGIEAQYESLLRGAYGRRQIEVDALGRQTAVLAQEAPTPGDNIIISIDVELQKKSQEILAKYMRIAGSKRGAVIISDPDSGEILTMISAPYYDNNIFSGGLSYEDYAKLQNNPNNPMLNRAIAGTYPSGSVVKPIIAAAALQEGIITEKTTFLSTGGIKINNWFFPDWKAGGHGITDARKALAESINTFFYIIGGGLMDPAGKNFTFTGLGVEKIVEWAKKFSLASKLGIDLPGEATGFLPSKDWKQEAKGEVWYIGDTYHLAIGQGDLLVTPLQVNSWTAVFANGGTIYQPHLLKTIVMPDNSVQNAEIKILNQDFVDQKNINTVRQGMRDCVTYGSCRAFSDLDFTVAGKTGTAQWAENKPTHAWFTGFAPYNNPQIAITVLIEEGGEGSTNAVPVAKEILRWYFDTYNPSAKK